jgi:7-carboxy-7-deazaguanine synthase
MSESLYISEIFSSIQGEGLLAGRRQIFIRLAECNLDCVYCDTVLEKTATSCVETKPGSAVFNHLPQPLSLDTVLGILKDWLAAQPGAHHSVSITGGEPLLSADILDAWLPAIRKLLPIHLETNGTMHLALEKVLGHIDYISMDMKLPSTAGCSVDLWALHRLFLQASFRHKVSVKIVVGNDTNDNEIKQVCDTMAAVDPAIPLFIQPVTLPSGCVGVSAKHILYLQELASSRLPDVRVIPQMHKLLGAL